MKTPSEQSVSLPGIEKRIAAFIIDHFILTFLMVSITFLSLGSDFMDGDNIDKMTATMLAVMLPGFMVYFAKDSVKGISIGKWVLGIMVRDANDPHAVPSFGRLLIRNLFIVIWPVEFIMLVSNKEKKRLGDKTAKTIVVMNPHQPTTMARVSVLVGFGIAFFVFILLFAGSAMKNSDVYKVAIKEIEHNEEILTETGGIKGYGIMPSGNVSTHNGNGQAQLQITVIGNEKDLDVNVYLTKEPNAEWELVELTK